MNELRIDQDSAPLLDEDRLRLVHAETALGRGLAVKDWWQRKTGGWPRKLDEDALDRYLAGGIHPKCFRLTRRSDQWPEDLAYGFFDQVSVNGLEMPVVGRAQQQIFDRPRIHMLEGSFERLGVADPNEIERRLDELLELWRDSLAAFVRYYLLRCGNFQTHRTSFVDPERRPLDRYLRPWSWIPREPTESELARGVVYTQLYYKRRDTGRVGKFRQVDIGKIDLEEVDRGGKYTWIIATAGNRGHALTFRPGPSSWPYLALPLNQDRLGVLSEHFLIHDEVGVPGEYRGRFGFGFALSGNPMRPRLIRHGFSTTDFLVEADGRILVRKLTIRRRPRRLLTYLGGARVEFSERVYRAFKIFWRPWLVPFGGGSRWLPPASAFDPVLVSIDLANRLTHGFAGEELGITRQQLEGRFLAEGVIRDHHALDMVKQVWDAVPDWTREDEMPEWARECSSR